MVKVCHIQSTIFFDSLGWGVNSVFILFSGLPNKGGGGLGGTYPMNELSPHQGLSPPLQIFFSPPMDN